MRCDELGRIALALALALGLGGACSDDPGPGGDGSVSDGAGPRECSTDLFCSNGFVEEEYRGDAGRCLRRRVYTCKEGCKVFSATTTLPAMLCKEGLPDRGAAPDLVADAGPAADVIADALAGDLDATAADAADATAADAADATVADGG